MKLNVLYVLLFAAALQAYPQEAEESPAVSGAVETVLDGETTADSEAVIGGKNGGEREAAIYVIRDISYHTKGWTKPFAIAYNVDLKTGVEFRSTEDLDVYVGRKTQDLRNQRVFEANKCLIEYTLGAPEADGKIPVFLDVYTEDSWNIIVLPEPKYDSNTGFSLTLKGRDYNFLGTMSALRLDIGYELDNDGKHTYGFLLDSDFPFRALGFTWTFNFDNELDYTIGDPLYYKNTTGISMDFPWKTTTFTFGFNQHLYVNEENGDDEKAATGIVFFEDTWYMASELYAQWKIPTGIDIGNFGSLDYTPRISETLKYRPGGDVGDWRRSTLSLSHSIGFGRVNWLKNYRQGVSVSLSNSNDLNQSTLNWNNSVSLTAAAHYRLTERLGVSSRFRFQAWRGDPYTDAGDVLRGLHNDDLSANKMLSLNVEFPFTLIRFVPSEWFRRKSWRIFDFEQQWSPFIDLAMADDPKNEYGVRFEPSGIITTMGLEVITFPLRWRSIYLRISAGWDMREWLRIHKPPAGVHRELFIGLGHFF
ncbi:MAG: hypothetical protein LBI67_09315 [Treponema sp.]|jgi:hypothetical protein|nr:hypothetical protein [Treponema sp.]